MADDARWQAGCRAEDLAGVLVYRLHGDLGYDARDLLVFDKPVEDFRAVVVALAEVTFFGSTPLNALLGLRRRAEPLGMPVHLCAVPATAARVLEVTGADVLFQHHGDLAAALTAVHPQDLTGDPTTP
jgi:anti-sigma B factor antagonist